MGEPEVAPGATLIYTCPMHPDVASEQPGRCPDCGMKLLATETPGAPTGYACPMHPAVAQPRAQPLPGMRDEARPAALVNQSAVGEAPQPIQNPRIPTSMMAKPTRTRQPEASSGKTTWSRSTS